MVHNTSLGRAAGLSDEQIAVLDGDWRASALFDDRQKAVIDWAEHVTANTARRAGAAFERLTQHFDETEIVELTVAVAHRNMITRIQEALHTDLEGTALPPRTRITAPASTLERYVREVLAR